jgi:predicted ATPase
MLHAWRRELEAERHRALMLRIDADLSSGAAAEMTSEIERLIAEHPYEERLWAQLMLALYRSGRQADALDAYRQARRRLVDELGLEPGEELARLQQRILERDPTLSAPRRPRGGETRRASRLPRSLTRLVGREHELDALTGLFADPDVRIVSLIGLGGVGKTRLALEFARLQEPDHEDGAIFIALEHVTDAALVATEIASGVGHHLGLDRLSPDDLFGALRDRELVLVLDNLEHLLPSAPLIAELAAAAPAIRVVVATRAAMRIRGEVIFEVEPLELPKGESHQDLARSPAVQLFLQLALAANRQIEVDPATTSTAARICRALDGLPLAIELAASRAHSLTIAQIAEQLTEPISIGAHGLRDLPRRQQTLDDTIRWSFVLLSEDARQVLCGAAVFLGGFTLPALEAVSGGGVGPQLEELLEASLVRRTPEEDRFELLELVRAFSLGELRTRGQEAQARERHRQYFRAQIAPAGAAFTKHGFAELERGLLRDHANVRAALEDAIEVGDEESAVAIALGLRPLWLRGALRQECHELVGRVLDRFSIDGAAEVALLWVAALVDFGPTGYPWLRRTAARAAEIGDRETVAIVAGNMFARALNAQDHQQIEQLRPELHAILSSGASDKALGQIHSQLAYDAYVQGQFDAACQHAVLSLEKARSIAHDGMIARAVATLLFCQSARDGVITHAALTEAIELIRRPGVPPTAIFGLWLVARYAADVDPTMAAQWLAHAERILTALRTDLWPESVLRDETLAILALRDLGPVLERTPALDHTAALAAATAWLAGRDPAESATRPRRSELVRSVA